MHFILADIDLCSGLQRIAAVDLIGVNGFCSSTHLFVDGDLCSGVDLNALMIFAVVCSGLQRIAAVIQ